MKFFVSALAFLLSVSASANDQVRVSGKAPADLPLKMFITYRSVKEDSITIGLNGPAFTNSTFEEEVDVTRNTDGSYSFAFDTKRTIKKVFKDKVYAAYEGQLFTEISGKDLKLLSFGGIIYPNTTPHISDLGKIEISEQNGKFQPVVFDNLGNQLEFFWAHKNQGPKVGYAGLKDTSSVEAYIDITR